MTPEELPTRERRLPLAALAQLAEIVASLAVVATLVYLVVEVRQNTEVTQAAAYDRSMEGLNQWRSMLSSDPELARLWASFMENGEVDQERVEEVRLQLVIVSLWGVYENAYYSNQRELLGPSEWNRFERQICTQYDRAGIYGRWSDSPAEALVPLRTLLTEEFAAYVETSCQSGN